MQAKRVVLPAQKFLPGRSLSMTAPGQHHEPDVDAHYRGLQRLRYRFNLGKTPDEYRLGTMANFRCAKGYPLVPHRETSALLH